MENKRPTKRGRLMKAGLLIRRTKVTLLRRESSQLHQKAKDMADFLKTRQLISIKQ